MEHPIVPIKKQLSTLEEIKDAMLTACKIMDTFGLLEALGHISSRIPNTSNFLVTARKALGLMEEKDLVIVDKDGKLIEGNAIPFAEIYMHLGIYQNRPDVGAICRFHTEMTSVFGVLNRSIRVVHAVGYLLGPEVRVLSSPELAHTDEILSKMGELISDSYGLIFRGNGAATFGTNVIDACVRGFLLEESTKIQYKASLLGEPIYLSDEEMNRRNEDYLALPDYDFYWRLWEYYKNKIK